MNNILVTGANGQLGKTFQALAKKYTNYRFHFCRSDTLDITNTTALNNFIDEKNINILINCAAYTAVDNAEDDQERANAINHIAVTKMAEIAKNKDLKLIHFSTDYVFNGKGHRPYDETEKTDPIGIYGATKDKGEKSILRVNPNNCLIIRTAWVYAEFGNNFVKTMLKLGTERDQLSIVCDQIGSPTYAKNLAETVLNILPKINHSGTEILHFTNEGVCSWYDFTKAIFEIKQINCEVNAIPSSAYPTKAKRPYYSVLSKEKIKNTYHIQIPYWKDALMECLEKL